MEIITGEWIKARLKGGRSEKARLAEAMGVTPDILSKVLSGVRQLKQGEAVLAREHLEPALFAQAQPTAPGSAFGFSESAVTPWQPAKLSEAALPAFLRFLAPSAHRPETWRVAQTMAAIGMLAGDVLVVDLKAAPRPGDLVLVGIDRPDQPISVIRRFAPPFLISVDPADPDPVVSLDDHATYGLRGPIVALFRTRTSAT
jgi:hypothetical protein